MAILKPLFGAVPPVDSPATGILAKPKRGAVTPSQEAGAVSPLQSEPVKGNTPQTRDKSASSPSKRELTRAVRVAQGMPVKKFVPRMGQHLPPAKLEELFAAYCQLPNIRHIAKVCGVKISTARVAAAKGNFKARRTEIIERAKKEQNYTLKEATRKSIELVRNAKEKIGARILLLKPEELKAENLTADIEKLVKLEQLLLGGVESREEHVHSLSHEERIRRLREARQGREAAHRELPGPPKALTEGAQPLPIAEATLGEVTATEEKEEEPNPGEKEVQTQAGHEAASTANVP